MIPPKGSIPRRKPKELGDLLKGVLAGLTGELNKEVGNLLSGILKGLGKTLESVQNLNLGDLMKLAETQGSEEAKEKIAELKKILKEKGIGDIFGEGLDLSKLIDFAVKHGGKGMIQGGLRGHILGMPLAGKNLPLDRKRTQETSFEVKGTRPQGAREAPEKTKPKSEEETRQPNLDLFDEEDFILIIGEMPGVNPEEIKYQLKGGFLTVWTEGAREYRKEIELPSPVTEEIDLKYRNGVLEIKLIKKERK